MVVVTFISDTRATPVFPKPFDNPTPLHRLISCFSIQSSLLLTDLEVTSRIFKAILLNKIR